MRKNKTEALPTSNELFDRLSKANQVVEHVNKVIQYKKQQEMILSQSVDTMIDVIANKFLYHRDTIVGYVFDEERLNSFHRRTINNWLQSVSFPPSLDDSRKSNDSPNSNIKFKRKLSLENVGITEDEALNILESKRIKTLEPGEFNDDDLMKISQIENGNMTPLSLTNSSQQSQNYSSTPIESDIKQIINEM